ncbi:MAG: BMP family ABC transporter substrate-binding protein [Solirubrobacteraceae bacterium]
MGAAEKEKNDVTLLTLATGAWETPRASSASPGSTGEPPRPTGALSKEENQVSKFKWMMVVVLLVVAAAVTAGCGGSDGSSTGTGAGGGTATADTSTAGGKEAVKLGVIMEARPEVEPWSAAWHDSLEKLSKEDGAVSFKEAYNGYQPTQAQPLVQQLMGQGYGVIVYSTFTLNDIARSLSKANPDVPAVVTSFDHPQPPNLSIGTTSYLQIGYSTCWLLMKLSQSGKIGYVGSQPVPFDQEIIRGCALGAKAANPSGKILKAYTNSFTDLQKNQQQMQSLLDQGADTIYLSSGTEDVLGGLKLCEQKKVDCASWGSDIRRWAPNYGTFSAVLDWSPLLAKLVEQRRTKQPEAIQFDATYKNKMLVPQPFDGATGKRVPQDVQEEFNTMIAGLADGSIKLPPSKAHPCCP